MKIHKGDTVEVISGPDKHKRGEVIRVLPGTNSLVIQGVNVRKKHQSRIQAQGRNLSPGIIEFEAPVHVSNVMLVCPSCDEPSRVSVKRTPEEVTRICKHCGAEIK
jgi:large subunit ribosomal protein L24